MIAEVIPVLPSVPLPLPPVLPWWPFSAGDTILIISAVFNGVLLLLTAWRTGSIKRMGQITQEKVDVVKHATNSHLSEIDGELRGTRADLRETRVELASALKELQRVRELQPAPGPSPQEPTST